VNKTGFTSFRNDSGSEVNFGESGDMVLTHIQRVQRREKFTIGNQVPVFHAHMTRIASYSR
jgi:hypothetical protein